MLFFHPSPAPPGFAQSKVLPEVNASWLSRLVFHWLGPFLSVGYSRPLEKDDLWELPNSLQTLSITNELEANFYKRCSPEERPHFFQAKLNDSSGTPLLARSEKDSDQEKGWDDSDSQLHKGRGNGKRKSFHDASLIYALHETFFFRWWIAGICRLFSEILRVTAPLVTRELLAWLTDTYKYHHLTNEEQTFVTFKPRGVGFGIGLAFALFAMQEAASLLASHYFQNATATGLFVRTGVSGAIFRKSLRLSGRARLVHSVGQIMTIISTDTARLDRFAQFAHSLWITPIEVTIGAAVLINNMGYSALVGLGVFLLGFPIQFFLVKMMFMQRQRGVNVTDMRQQLTTEVLQGIRLIKYYAWEQFYVSQVSKLRTREIRTIKATSIARSLLIAVVVFTPVLASILSFITYGLSGHELTVAIVFSSLQIFNVIRIPLSFLPTVFSSLSDALIALTRIKRFLTAEEIAEPYLIDCQSSNALEVDGDFTWETTRNTGKHDEQGGWYHAKKNKEKEPTRWKFFEREERELPTTMSQARSKELAIQADDDNSGEEMHEKPFELKNLKFRVPKGSFIAIVGRVGCGKSSVLQALIGEMRRTRGEVIFGGSVAYVPQTTWIRNATLRENIVFGEEDNEDKFRKVINSCSLEHDLETLPDGEETEIGEKGINLSGGQKARISLARAAYSKSDVILLDDSLSALDAYVGQAILENCILSDPLAGRTRILVTHALHVLDKTDYIYVMEHGAIVEQGTYEALKKDSVVFAHLIDEYGSLERGSEVAHRKRRKGHVPLKNSGERDKKSHVPLMQMEERLTGSVSWITYRKYFRFTGNMLWVPAILTLTLVSQITSVGNNVFLGFWTGGSVPGFSQKEYMAVYAALGVAQAMFAFLLNSALAFAGLAASLSMFKAAFQAVLRSPESFFDTTPIGRILSRLSKDQDILDNELAMTLATFLYTFSSVLGTVALVFYTFPPFGTIFVPISLLYYIVSAYYRHSSVETKRLDSLLRSSLYSLYSETLTGLSTIRAYGQQQRTVTTTEHSLDLQNRAAYMSISIQRWLSVRVDLTGNMLVLGIALFAVVFRNSTSPSKVGVVLSYTLGIMQTFSEMVSQFAQNEQNMNAVERVLVYTELPPEGVLVTPNDPPLSWPEKGGIKFTNVELAYREGLPLVLKGISFEVKAGEKIGIVGRTGAGKSSLLQALFRMAKIRSGVIDIDGYNISNIGLDVLRSSLALVPQDTTLFPGTLRENLDPQGTRTDAELIFALQRAYLLPRAGHHDPAAEAKFSLDSTVSDEGSNYSAGEKQLLALCRALVKNSRIIVLDEATSNVDVETDSKVQRTIQIEFAPSTLLCIAHRLNTVAYCDKVMVMDDGKVAEFDTVLNLFDREDSTFRSLCNEANLSRQDILRIRAESAFPS